MKKRRPPPDRDSAGRVLFSTPHLPLFLSWRLGMRMIWAWMHEQVRRRFFRWLGFALLYLVGIMVWVLLGPDGPNLSDGAWRGLPGDGLWAPYLLEEWAAFLPAMGLGALLLALVLYLRSDQAVD